MGRKIKAFKRGEKGDFIVETGPNKGKSVDFLFTADTRKAKEMINKHFDKNPTNLSQIKDHVDKADIVPLDMRNLNSTNASKVINFINKERGHSLFDADQKITDCMRL
ncbi:hypothetical protein [Zooshikella harenae]|uniref:hypothetical protein n=1 Tax=Zooshikella harenae TaxID=2827238 RepID=UPI002815F2D8|nr:hypothetical protein [Zooshikella harenae]